MPTLYHIPRQMRREAKSNTGNLFCLGEADGHFFLLAARYAKSYCHIAPSGDRRPDAFKLYVGLFLAKPEVFCGR